MTTPSPTFPFRQPSELADTLDIEDLDPKEREERQKAVQKFLERAEFSKVGVVFSLGVILFFFWLHCSVPVGFRHAVSLGAPRAMFPSDGA